MFHIIFLPYAELLTVSVELCTSELGLDDDAIASLVSLRSCDEGSLSIATGELLLGPCELGGQISIQVQFKFNSSLFPHYG